MNKMAPKNNLVNSANIDNLGERPQNFMGPFQAAVYEQKLLQIREEERLAREQSENLAKISGVIITAWELQELLAKIPEGMSLVVNNGEIYIGRVSEERLGKMRKVGKRIAKKMPSNLDTAEIEYKKIVTKSFAEPATVAGFKVQWKTALRKAPTNHEFPLLQSFLDWIDEHPDNKIHWRIEEKGRQDFEVTISVDGLKTKVTTNTFGRVLRYQLPDGKWVERYQNRL